MKTPEDKIAKVLPWAEKNPEKVSEIKRRWAEKNRHRLPDIQRAWRQRNTQKRKCHEAVNNAIRDGRLNRLPCQVCGSKGEAHHEDYSKPFDVKWLCKLHHSMVHRKVRAAV